MTYDPNEHHRRSIRLSGYEYAQTGAYFITICTQDKACLFGEVVDGKMRLNDAGRMVGEAWDALRPRFPTVDFNTFVVMPNHVHGVIFITPAPVGAGLVPAPNYGAATVGGTTVGAEPIGATTRVAPTIGDVVGAYKSWTTVLYARGVRQSGWPPFRRRVWQRNYYEHIVRSEESLNQIRQYILDNPMRWSFDRENPAAETPGGRR